MSGALDIKAINEKVQKESIFVAQLTSQIGQAVIGQTALVERMLIGLLADGHILLEGVPGLAKTLMVSTLARILDVGFKRVQFTPDLMPSDITGTNVLEEDETGRRRFRFVEGPIFTNILLADEINRTPPKTQAAFLQAMQEREVSVGQETYSLPDPFFTIATQNPIEQEGTYPLPEAQLDRFMFMINVDYPSPAEEILVMKRSTVQSLEPVEPVLGTDQILYLQNTVRRMPVADHVFDYAQQLVGATRTKTPQALEFCKKWLSWGAGPRAAMNLVLAAKAHAMLHGQVYVGCENVAAVALPIMRHRMIPNFTAQSEGITSDDITRRLLKEVRPSKGE